MPRSHRPSPPAAPPPLRVRHWNPAIEIVTNAMVRQGHPPEVALAGAENWVGRLHAQMRAKAAESQG